MGRKELMLAAVQRGKYAPLYDFLVSQDVERVEMSFSQLEHILGFKLPNSALLYRPWWANQDKSGHSQSMAWTVAGWKTAAVDLDQETLRFEKVGGISPPDQGVQNASRNRPQDFWVYENWTHDKAVVHAGDCSYCNHGKGMHIGSTKRNGHWLGPFSTESEAEREAALTGRGSIQSCKRC